LAATPTAAYAAAPGGASAVSVAVANTACTVELITFNTGFLATVTIVNNGPAATNGWTVRFSLPGAVPTWPSFNGRMVRDETGGTITPMVWDAVIGPGGRIPVGFSGGAIGPVLVPPSGFTVDGSPCAVA